MPYLIHPHYNPEQRPPLVGYKTKAYRVQVTSSKSHYDLRDIEPRKLDSKANILFLHTEFKALEMLILWQFSWHIQTFLCGENDFLHTVTGQFQLIFLHHLYVISLAAVNQSLPMFCINISLLLDFKYVQTEPRIESMTNCQIHVCRFF